MRTGITNTPQAKVFTPAREDPVRAILFMLGSTVFIATASLLAKALTTGAIGPALSPLQVSHGRFIFALLGIAGAALVLAGLRAEGETTVTNAGHIDRGYDGFVSKLSALGARISRE